jgi:hypothetical protein
MLFSYQVEWVLMRAMSLGLIKGIIDGVEEVVNVTWVQPRVLDKDQLNLLHDQLGAWTERYYIYMHNDRSSHCDSLVQFALYLFPSPFLFLSTE